MQCPAAFSLALCLRSIEQRSASPNVRFEAHYGFNSDVDPSPKSANSRQQPWPCIRSDSDSLPAIPFPLRQALPRRVSVSSPSEYQGVCEKSKAFSRLFAAASRLPRGAKSQRVSMNFKIEVVSYVVLSTKRRLA